VMRAREERGAGAKLAQQMAFNRRNAPAFIGEHPNAVRYVESDDFGA